MATQSDNLFLPMQPTAQTIPSRPDRGRWGLRLGVLLVWGVVLLQPIGLHWAERVLVDDAQGTEAGIVVTVPSSTWAPPDPHVPLKHLQAQTLPPLARVVRALYRPPWLFLPLAVVALSGLVLVGELAVAAIALIRGRARLRQTPRTVVRVRLPSPQARTTGRGKTQGAADLWRALHPSLLSLKGVWIAATMHGQAQRPVELCVAICGARATDRAAAVAAVRRAIVGIDSEAQVGEVAVDPLAQELRPGRLVAWCDYSLLWGPSYPMRSLDAMESDSLGQLLAAVEPRAGVIAAELQVIVRPRADRGMAGQWRIWLRRRVMQMRKHLIVPDAAAKLLDAKLNDPAAFETLVRAVVVATDTTERASAQLDLQALGATLGQYRHRSGSLTQQWIAVGRGRVVVPDAPRPQRTVALMAAGAAALGTLLGGLIGWGLWETTMALLPALLLPLAGSLVSLAAITYASGAATQSRLAYLLARAPRLTPAEPILAPTWAWWRPAVLSAGEVAGLWHLPGAAQGTLVRWLSCRWMAAPDFATTRSPGSNDIIFGWSTLRDGTKVAVAPTIEDVRLVTHITAGMGAGKSRFLANQALQWIPHGFLLIDGKGDDEGCLANTVRTLIPATEEGRLRVLDLLDAAWPVGLNPLAGLDPSRTGDVDKAVGRVTDIIARNEAEGLEGSPGMTQYLINGTTLVMQAQPNPTMIHIVRALIDDDYRAALLPRCTNPQVIQFWTLVYPKTGEQQKTSRDAILRRFDNLLSNELTRYLLAQPHPTFEFLEAIEGRQIVIIPLPHRALGELLTRMVSTILVKLFVDAVYRRPGTVQTRRPYGLLIDELQVITGAGDSADVRAMVTQLRSFNIAIYLAHQALAQLDPKIRDETLQSASLRIMMRTREPDASAYARLYPDSPLTAADLSGQDPDEHQYAVVVRQNKPTKPISIEPLAWPAPLVEEHPTPPRKDWWNVLPANTTVADPLIARLAHDELPAPQRQHVVEQLARMPAARWAYLQARWRLIRAAQRAYLLTNPGCIRDTLERQATLSWLCCRTPYLLAAAEDQRARWAVEPEADAFAVVTPPKEQQKNRTTTRPAAAPGERPTPPASAQVDGLAGSAAVAEVPAPLDKATLREALAAERAEGSARHEYRAVPDHQGTPLLSARPADAEAMMTEIRSIAAQFQTNTNVFDRAALLQRRDQLVALLQAMGRLPDDLDTHATTTLQIGERAQRTYLQITRAIAPEVQERLRATPFAQQYRKLVLLARLDADIQRAVVEALLAEPTREVADVIAAVQGSAKPVAPPDAVIEEADSHG